MADDTNNEQEREEVTLSMGPLEGSQNEAVKSDTVDEVAVNQLSIRIGDMFIYPSNSSIVMTVLDVSQVTNMGVFYKVRLYAVIVETIDVSRDEIIKYIEREGLLKLTTYRDHMEEINKTLIFKDGDVFTRNGEFFLEVLTAEMLYVEMNGTNKYIIGIKTSDGLVAFRDAVEVKSMVYKNTDQFPAEVE